MAGGDASASRDALARAVAAAKAASRPRLASVFAKSSDPRYAPRPEANYGERWEAQEALATVAGAGPAAAKLGLEHPEHEPRDGAARGETRTGDASTSGRPNDSNDSNDSNEAPVDGNRPTWVETVDGDSGVPYYFNPETRETSWEAPHDARLLKHDYESNLKVSGSVGDDRGVVRVEDAAAAAAVNDDETRCSADPKEKKMYWYRDDAGAWRGPYSFDRLRFWRASLPALLPVVDFDPDKKDATVDREGDVESRAIALANLLGDERVFLRAAALGIAAHPRATAAQIERAIADVRARSLTAKERDDDDNDDDEDDATNPRASRDALITDRAAARRAIYALPKTHRDAILGGAFDPSEAARAVANAAFRSVPETATLNRVTGRLSVRSNASSAFGRGGADTRTGPGPDERGDAERKRSRPTAGPRPRPGPGPAQAAAYKERKRRRRDAWLDT